MIEVKTTWGADEPFKTWTFPGGERNIKFNAPLTTSIQMGAVVVCKFKSSDDVMDMLLVVNALRNAGVKKISLQMPYFPFARQDRVMTDGEPFALQVFADVVKLCNFESIEVEDPHSDVLAGMFPAGVLKIKQQHEMWAPEIFKELRNRPTEYPNPCLVSPDAGALKKIYKLAKTLDLPVVEAGKQRDVSTGEIVATTIDTEQVAKYQTFFVVDDICDGGRTFIELAKVIRSANPTAKLVLCVTHGIFSKGKEVLKPAFDEVITINDLSEIK